MQAAPIVYLGPTLPHRDAEAMLPGCVLRAPIRRGDLYRDRRDGGSFFVIIDGVLHQEPAVPPREILDVLEDGAVVVGASSMGALRAAECWPAGMLGVGTIYRLYRRGSLQSDDEVVVVHSPDGDYAAWSVPLINVRYALSRALHQGRLARREAERIVACAERMHFSERRWPVMLSNAEVLDPDGELHTMLSSLDLKREDAVRCLRTVARWLAQAPALSERPRRHGADFIPSELRRERDYDALAGLDREEVKRELGRWQLISGRYARHLLAIAAAGAEVGLAARLEKSYALAPLLAVLSDRGDAKDSSKGDAEPQVYQRIMALRLVLVELWKAVGADQPGFAEALWAELAASSELDAEIFRWRAVRDAARVARSRGLSSRARDRFVAEAEIAHAHGFRSWRDLHEAASLAPFPWSDFVQYRDELALAKRLREELFNPPAFGLAFGASR
jgi:hypothetical protein